MPHDVCHVLLILFVVLANLETTISIHHVHPGMGVLSLNISSSFIGSDPTRIELSSDESNFVEYYARYRADSPPAGGYAGGMATLDVYSHPDIKSGEFTAAIMWVSNGNPGQSDLNDMQAGWTVDSSHYGDTKTHFFVSWTADGYKSTGCFNLECNGFVPVNGAPITPGDTLVPANGQSKISFKIFKNKDDGDWWLHYGYDINNLKPVGFWPKSIFTNLKDQAAGFITWGGTTMSPKGNASPPMGDGQWPGKNSASFQNVQLVDSSGQGYALPDWALSVFASNKKCYQVSTFFDRMFYYGGPGGCTD